jgi:hypothetical protein
MYTVKNALKAYTASSVLIGAMVAANVACSQEAKFKFMLMSNDKTTYKAYIFDAFLFGTLHGALYPVRFISNLITHNKNE